MKVMFVLYKRKPEESLGRWNGGIPPSIDERLPGLKKWVKNPPAAVPGESGADGIGELWFDSIEAMERALGSPETVAAVEDAERFLDMDRTYALVVDETTVID
jgi:uncharacterized protein (TIGR02118 family)